eukprot:NODE_3468_length_664_cov_284.512195_g2470_i0.p2 GENE.NODE_3468_length_664_cov_284.512195_g2470_i0~~NODE_3468_length_664_cov_284.512195_g2470_i0.p2  ORF type:complete len:135 (+),score=41.25 NODE_3468_length_664_cov_284.512195_g2470_i0:61-465(+)
MSSGVKANDECITAFNSLKLKKTSRYIAFKLSADKKFIEVETESARDATFDDFVASLTKEPRYFVYDFDFEAGGLTKNKMLFITWNPDDGSPMQKMVYSSSKDALKNKIEGGLVEVQCNGKDDVTYDYFVSKAK